MHKLSLKLGAILGVSILMGGGMRTLPRSSPQIRLVKVAQLDTLPDQMMDGEVGPSGRFCLVDGAKGEVRCFSAGGRTIWRAGRSGDGPGEYRGLYRIAISPNGSVFAFDIARMMVTQYDSTGKWLRSGTVPFFFRQAGDLVATGDSGFVISGYAPMAGAASRNGVHLFRWDSTITHLQSVGRLPATIRPELLNFWGSGNLRLGFDGTLLYQVANPHEVIVFDQTGTILSARAISIEISGPDQVFDLEESATKFAVRRSRQRSVMPLGVEALSPGIWVMERRISPDSAGGQAREIVDAISSTGSPIASWVVPDSLSPMGLIDGPSTIRSFFGVSASESGMRILQFEFRQ